MLLVVLPAGIMTGLVAWTLHRKGGFLGLLLSALGGSVGAFLGYLATPALVDQLSTPRMTLGTVLGALLASALMVFVLRRTPRPIDDPHVQSGPSSPINDPRTKQPGRPPLRSSHV
jgi:uncharacterized membrane protein YeaQ/YmgE (transglycosylase-associated protein family)